MRKWTFLIMFVIGAADAAVVDVFFAGGQSNAGTVWKNAIETALIASGRSPVLVHTQHSGNKFPTWWDGGPAENYKNDFFNAAGSGALQSELNSITASGDTPIFRGFFWYQGEGDVGPSPLLDYADRFDAMMDQIALDLGTSGRGFTVVNMIIDFDYTLTAPTIPHPDNVEYIRNQLALVGSKPNSRYVDTRGFAHKDGWHPTAASYEALGVLAAQEFLYISEVPIPSALFLILGTLPFLVHSYFEKGTRGSKINQR